MRRPWRLLDPAYVVAAMWGLLSVWRVRRFLASNPVEDLAVAPPPRLPDRARRGVLAAMRLSGATCLQESAVLQRWDAEHGRPRDLVIGVKAPVADFQAHAWLQGDPDGDIGGFSEFLRIPPPLPAGE